MILITGCAGFIGFHITNKLLSNKIKVVGIDSLDNYYPKFHKYRRLKILKKNKNFKFLKVDLKKFDQLKIKLKNLKIDHVIHLAAQPGVRISISNPHNTLNQNLISFSNIIEISRLKKLKNLYMHLQVQFTVILKFIHLEKMILKIFLFQYMGQQIIK